MINWSFHNISVLLYFYQINKALVSRRDFKKIKKILLTPNFWMVVHINKQTNKRKTYFTRKKSHLNVFIMETVTFSSHNSDFFSHNCVI